MPIVSRPVLPKKYILPYTPRSRPPRPNRFLRWVNSAIDSRAGYTGIQPERRGRRLCVRAILEQFRFQSFEECPRRNAVYGQFLAGLIGANGVCRAFIHTPIVTAW